MMSASSNQTAQPIWLGQLCGERATNAALKDADVCDLGGVKDRLRAAMARYMAPSEGSVSWHEVLECAALLLRDAQDLKVAAYAVLASTHLGGAESCAQGLLGLASLLEQHWSELLPPLTRMRGREVTLVWLQDQLVDAWRAKDIASSAHGGELVIAAQRLDQAIELRLLGQGPRFAPHLRAATASKAAASVTPALEQAAQSLPQNAAAKLLVCDVAAYPPADDLKAWGELLLRRADEQLQLQPFQVEALRLRRVGLWLHIVQAPPSTAGKTLIEPLSVQLQKELATLQQSCAWQQLHELCEAAMVQNRLQLSLQRLSAMACERSAGSHERAARVLAEQAAALLHRLPALKDCRAADGSWLVDDATKQWLQQCSVKHEQSPETSVSQGPSPATPRQQFLRDLLQAESLDSSVAPPIVHAAWRALSRTAHQQQLHTWEPDLAVRTFSQEAQALARLPAKNGQTDRILCLLSRIAHIDLRKAQQLSSTLQMSRSAS